MTKTCKNCGRTKDNHIGGFSCKWRYTKFEAEDEFVHRCPCDDCIGKEYPTKHEKPQKGDKSMSKKQREAYDRGFESGRNWDEPALKPQKGCNICNGLGLLRNVKGEFEPCPACENHSPSDSPRESGTLVRGKPRDKELDVRTSEKNARIDASGSFNLSEFRQDRKYTKPIHNTRYTYPEEKVIEAFKRLKNRMVEMRLNIVNKEIDEIAGDELSK